MNTKILHLINILLFNNLKNKIDFNYFQLIISHYLEIIQQYISKSSFKIILSYLNFLEKQTNIMEQQQEYPNPKNQKAKLKTLQFSNSTPEIIIKEVQNHFYSELKIIKMLNCQLVQFPSINAPKLKNLFLEGNIITKLLFLQSYLHLKSIDLSCNGIIQLPKLNLLLIQKINLSSNKIVLLDQFCKGSYPNLFSLYLRSNKIIQIPEFEDASNLKNISASYNQIKTVERFFLSIPKKQSNLQIIMINFNLLTELKSINHKKLKKIHIKENDFNYQCKFFKQSRFQNLQNFSAYNCSLRQIPIFLYQFDKKCNFEQLIYLNLGNNEISNIQSLSQLYLNSLESLNMEYNYINSLKVFQKLQMLSVTWINLYGNYIKYNNFFNRVYLENVEMEKKELKLNEPQKVICLRILLSYNKLYNVNKFKIQKGKKQIVMDSDGLDLLMQWW